MLKLPDLSRLFCSFDDDEAVHPGVYCISMDRDGFDTPVDQWSEFLDQWHTNLQLLAAHADKVFEETESGWSVGRPLLFAAGHVCELALKRRIIVDGATIPTGREGHNLATLVASEQERRGADLTGEEWAYMDKLAEWLDLFNVAARYPAHETKGDALAGSCCGGTAAFLVEVVETFVALAEMRAPVPV